MSDSVSPMTRLRGIVVLVNTFLPVMLALLFLWGGYAAAVKTKEMLVETRNSAEQIIRSAREAKESVVLAAGRAMEATETARERGEAIVAGIGGMANNFKEEVDNVRRTLNGAVEVIIQPNPNLGNLRRDTRRAPRNVVSPATKPFRTLGDQFASMTAEIGAIQDEIAAIAAEVANLRGLEAYLDAVIAEYENIRDDAIRALAILGKALRLAVFFVALLVIWIGIDYLLWFQGRLARGWAMARGSATA
ncbi:MAG: hypothetical protein ACLFRG_23500 [Desulfococcaceae bacterium]